MQDVVNYQIHRAHEQARDELRRADAKVTTLLPVVGAALGGVVALMTRQVSPAAMIGLWLTAAPMFAAVLVLLSAIRPRLSQFPTPGTWLDAVYSGPAVLLEATSSAARGAMAADITMIGGVAVRKNRQITAAVQLQIVGLCVLAVALVLMALT
jgi:hypothetical protein